MRSRYSAFCTGNIAYLLQTSHADYLEAENYTQTSIHPNAKESSKKTIKALEETIANTQWLGLKILSANHKTVEFVAFFYESFKKENQQPHQEKSAPSQLHECSRFVFENERWLYLDGEIKPPIKLGRNDECYCGSKKKIKKCCIKH